MYSYICHIKTHTMTTLNLNKQRNETKKVLRQQRNQIIENYGLGLLTVSEYTKMLDSNLSLINSKF